MEGLQNNENITALEGYDDRKEVILPKVVASQYKEWWDGDVVIANIKEKKIMARA